MNDTATSSAPPAAMVNGFQASSTVIADSQFSATPKSPEQQARRVDFDIRSWMPALIIASLVLFLYRHIAVKLVVDWRDLPDFSHGFLIPFFAAFLLWDKRQKLQQIPTQPTWSGIPFVALGVFVLLLGVLGADLFLQRTSFILLTVGIVWTLL